MHFTKAEGDVTGEDASSMEMDPGPHCPSSRGTEMVPGNRTGLELFSVIVTWDQLCHFSKPLFPRTCLSLIR